MDQSLKKNQNAPRPFFFIASKILKILMLTAHPMLKGLFGFWNRHLCFVKIETNFCISSLQV